MWLVHQGSRQPQLLPHASREVARPPVEEWIQTHEMQNLHATRSPFRRGQAAHFGEEADVFQHGQLLVEREALRQVADLGAGLLKLARDVITPDLDGNSL